MASTRNKNSQHDYNLEQKENGDILSNRTFELRRTAYHTALPCAGINVGHMPNNVLSCNPTATESHLYGIGSTNLVNPKRGGFTPRIRKLPSVSFFDRMQTYLPEPLVVEDNQRPIIP